MALLRLAALVLALLAGGAATAHAVVPETAVAGSGSKWFNGSLVQQAGENCSVVGSPYSEIMVSGIGTYGGTSGVVKVGQQYWTSVLLAVPGNPCGPGSSGIVTDLVLPRSTSIDASRPIRCFYLPRDATSTDQFVEVTGQSWQAFGGSGKICPATNEVTPSPYTSGAWNIGYRPVPSGAQLQVFVPVTSSTTLQGQGGPDKFSWVTHATGVYANPGLSEVWANVFSSGGDTPFVYFARTPSAVPFWKADAPSSPDQRNRVEFFANFYVAGRAGQITFVIRRTDTNAVVATSTTPGSGWDPNVPAGQDLLQVTATGSARGPNGGYVPFAYDAPGEWDVPMTITWTFTPSTGPAVSGTQAFRTLPGPDSDGDGVADARDVCASQKGTQADGCLPSAPPDPDRDGVYGAQDKCPDAAAPGVVDGCPAPTGGGQPPTTPPATSPPPSSTPSGTAGPPVQAALSGALRGLSRTTRLRGAALRRGVRVALTCSRDAAVVLVLDVDAKAGRALGLKGRRPVVARATGRCTAGRTATLVLKAPARVAARIGRLRRPAGAGVRATLTAPGATAATARAAVRIG